MKLLVLLSRVPYPLEKGDKLRAYHLMVRLARKHEILLCCLSDGPTDPAHIAHLRLCSSAWIRALQSRDQRVADD